MKESELSLLAGDVGYEIDMMAELCLRLREWVPHWDSGDLATRNAFVESYLVHLRSLAEMLLVTPDQKQFKTDVRRTFFRREWEPGPAESVAAVEATRRLTNHRVTHLTTHRASDTGPQLKEVLEAGDHLIAMLALWVTEVNPVRFHTICLAVQSAREALDGAPPPENPVMSPPMGPTAPSR